MPYKLKRKQKEYHREYHKKYYQRNKDQIDKKNVRWAKKHSGVMAKYRKKCYQKYKIRRIMAVRHWEKQNPEKVAEFRLRYAPVRRIVSRRHLLQRYNLTLDSYGLLLAQQNGKCAICQMTVEDSICHYRRAFDVDHSHSTGKVRGLLCMKCNGGLGLFVDNVVNLRRAINYLK